MKRDKYMGMDVHQATTVVAVIDAEGKIVLETIVATAASLLLMLTGAATAYARAVQADLILAKEGLIVSEHAVLENGETVVIKVKAHPCNLISTRAWAPVHRFVVEFGFSPVSRMRLPPDMQNRRGESLKQLEELLSQPRKPREPLPEELARMKAEAESKPS